MYRTAEGTFILYGFGEKLLLGELIIWHEIRCWIVISNGISMKHKAAVVVDLSYYNFRKITWFQQDVEAFSSHARRPIFTTNINLLCAGYYDHKLVKLADERIRAQNHNGCWILAQIYRSCNDSIYTNDIHIPYLNWFILFAQQTGNVESYILLQ